VPGGRSVGRHERSYPKGVVLPLHPIHKGLGGGREGAGARAEGGGVSGAVKVSKTAARPGVVGHLELRRLEMSKGRKEEEEEALDGRRAVLISADSGSVCQMSRRKSV